MPQPAQRLPLSNVVNARQPAGRLLGLTRWVGIAALGLLVGCAGLGVQGPAPGPGSDPEDRPGQGPEVAPTSPQTSPPDTPEPSVAAKSAKPSSGQFAPGTLYRLLKAEFGIRRGEPAMAVQTYLEVARETGDAGVAERATRMAVYARDEQAGLEAAKLWADLAQSLEASRVYATFLSRAGEEDQAVAQFQSIIERFGDGKGKGYDIVAGVLARERNKERRVRLMERITADAGPNRNRAMAALAQIVARSSQIQRATNILVDLHAAEPENDRYAAFYASLLRTQGKIEEALEVLSRQLERQAARPEAEQSTSVESPNGSAGAASGAGEVSRPPELRLIYARFLVDAKRFEQARAEFERLVAEQPERADIRYALGLLLLQTNHHEQAGAHFRKLLTLRQHVVEAHFYLGQIAEAEERYDEAIGHYRRVDRGDQYLTAQIRVAAIYAKTGRIARGRQHLGGVRRHGERDDVRLFRAEAELLARHDRFRDAMAVYTGALGTYPQNTDLLYSRAMMAARVDRYDILEADLRDILSREPDNADALNALGYTLADRDERIEEAHKLIKRAFELKPNDHYIVDSMGWVLYRMGRLEEAVTHLRKAMALRPDAEVAAHLGEVLWVLGNQSEAREVWNTALEATPNDKRILETIERLSK